MRTLRFRLIVTAALVGAMVAGPAAAVQASEGLVETDPCPRGYRGVIVTVNSGGQSHSVSACTNLIP